jgi:hypothetical protein
VSAVGPGKFPSVNARPFFGRGFVPSQSSSIREGILMILVCSACFMAYPHCCRLGPSAVRAVGGPSTIAKK